jgi:hypothetical protein
MFELVNAFLLELAPIAAVIFSIVATAVTTVLLKKYTAKLNAETTKTINDIVMDTVAEGIGYIEQVAKNAQKRNEEVKGSIKLHRAAAYIRTELEKRGIADITNTEIKSKIESMLGQGMAEGPILLDGGENDKDAFIG